VRICIREKGYEDREESGGLGSEESRRDGWDGNGNEVERCWEDVVEGRTRRGTSSTVLIPPPPILVAGESALKGCNEYCKVGRGRGSCRRTDRHKSQVRIKSRFCSIT